jgi:hypothetical protein
MRRTLLSVSVVAAVALLAWARNPAPLEKPAAAPPAAPDDYAAVLARRVDFPGVDDPKATLAEVLALMQNRYGVRFDVNERAFKNGEIQDVLKVPVAENGPIPPMQGVRLETVLNRVLARVPAASGAVVMVRRDALEITTGAFQRLEVWGEGFTGPFPPLVHARFDKKPLADALNELADQAQFNVLLDRRAADKAALPVSARFTNVPLTTAVRLLAESADLAVVYRDNVLFVTTPERAAALEEQFSHEVPEALDPGVDAGKWRRGPGHPGGVVPLGDAAALPAALNPLDDIRPLRAEPRMPRADRRPEPAPRPGMEK